MMSLQEWGEAGSDMDHREVELSYHCYLCGRDMKEAEVIPGQDKQVCDICEARLEFEG